MTFSERDTLIGNISDDSKEVNGFRLRLDFSSMTIEELREEAAYWAARQSEAFEDWQQEQVEEAAYETIDAAAEAVMPSAYDEIQDRLES